MYTGRDLARLAHQERVDTVAFSPNVKLLVAETGNWLHLYQCDGERWRPYANRHVPVIWPKTVRFVLSTDHCPRCVEVVRDVPENLLKLDRINFDEPAAPPLAGDPKTWLEEWSAKLGLTFDARGQIVPFEPRSSSR